MLQDGDIIPGQHKGAKSVTSYTLKRSDSTRADRLFEQAKKNLLNVNCWQEFAGPSTAKFTVIDQFNKETNECAKEGDYLRISIPVIPKTSAGHGFDWVRVEKISGWDRPGFRFIGMRVRPCKPPFEKSAVAHFFSPNATSTFCIEQKGRKVIATVYGRNENPNTKKVPGILAKLRNLFVALGAMAGLNKPQWKNLVEGLLTHTDNG